MLIDCDIHFDVLRDGHLCSVSQCACLDAGDDLFSQARAEAMEWIARQQRVRGLEYELIAIRTTIYQFHGKWYTDLAWDEEVLSYVESRSEVAEVPARDSF